MRGFTQNNRGRYKCDFCDHSTYKTWAGANTHVTENHPLELALAEKDYEISNLKKRIKDHIVKEKPTPKYWYIKNGGGIYCETCKIVQMGVGIPEGQTIEDTPHACGNRTLKLVLTVN